MKNYLILLIGIFLILHGLVHLWYVVLVQKLVPFKEEMGWTGESWLLPNSEWLATFFFSIAAIIFIMSGVSFIVNASYWKPILIISAILSSLVIIVFWDGSFKMLVEKGFFGFLINFGIIFF
jgi:hypothetical protein